jgi:diadenosine tetraphosphate (Ap4A) HIT family hydrolase
MLCLFCSIVDSTNFKHPEDEIIDETANFYAKAALGHFVFGYTLIISKEHLISYASLPVELFAELDSFSAAVRSKVERIAGQSVMMFEHGAISRPQRAGSCIDHAHLHLLPTADLLIPPLTGMFGFISLSQHSDITRFQKEQTPYLYFEKANGQQYAVSTAQDLPNQFIRRVASQHLNCSDLWDWREKPLRDRVKLFIQRYKQLT